MTPGQLATSVGDGDELHPSVLRILGAHDELLAHQLFDVASGGGGGQTHRVGQVPDGDRIVVMSDGRATTEVAAPAGGKPTPLDLVKEMV